MKKICPFCDIEFERRHHKQIYCSRECAVEYKRIQMIAYYHFNREVVLRWQHEYNARNREEVNRKRRERHVKYRERDNKRSLEYYYTHREEILKKALERYYRLKKESLRPKEVGIQTTLF